MGSKKQHSFASSSTKVKYKVITATVIELIWRYSLLTELVVTIPSFCHCDIVGATYLCANPVFHSRMKHVSIDFHFVCPLFQDGVLRVSHVFTASQLAYALTKAFTGSLL